MAIKALPYIEAARIYGESDLSIILRYILPNLVSTIIVLATLAMPSAILSTTSMGFLGLGAQQPLPDWGWILQNGIQYIKKAAWISMAPGLAIVWTVLAWVAGLLLDANLSLQPAGFLCLRVLLPILAMGLCILREIRKNGQK